MPCDQQQELSESEDDQQPDQATTKFSRRITSKTSPRTPRKTPRKSPLTKEKPTKEQCRLSFKSSAFTNMVVRFGRDGDFKNGFTMIKDNDRFNLSSLTGNKDKHVEHVINFSVSLPDGQLETKESLSLPDDTSTWAVVTERAFVRSEDFIVLHCGECASDGFVFRVMLKPGKHFNLSVGDFGSLSNEQTDLMFLKKYEDTVQEMRYFEVCIPSNRVSDSGVRISFGKMKQFLKDISSVPVSVIPSQQSVSLSSDSDSNTIQVRPVPFSTTRRVQGADFGSMFTTLSVDKKMNAIDRKIRAHIKDEQQLKECEEMIKEFERAIEQDDAVGPLGNGNVTSQIYRMVKEEVPHEMLDLFLMMGRLRVQKRKDDSNKKRKWDITGF